MGKPTQIENITTLQQQVYVCGRVKLEAMSELGLHLFYSEDKPMLSRFTPFLELNFIGYSNITVKKALADTFYSNLAIP